MTTPDDAPARLFDASLARTPEQTEQFRTPFECGEVRAGRWCDIDNEMTAIDSTQVKQCYADDKADTAGLL
jgi:hypothetical protein